MEILRELFQKQDMAYRDFQGSLIPTVKKERIIGVRTPELRAMAKALLGSDEAAEFLRRLPHLYFEENQLHAFLIETISDFDACVAALDAFLPYVDNWATCDSMSPKVLGRHKEALRVQVDRLHRPLRRRDADALVFGRRLPPGRSVPCRRAALGGLLCKNDGRVVLRHRACQAI